MSPVERAEKKTALVPHPDDLEDLAEGSGNEELATDVAGHLRWLETGEGEPWPPGSSQ